MRVGLCAGNSATLMPMYLLSVASLLRWSATSMPLILRGRVCCHATEGGAW
jgi:hypothetical protein